MKLLLLIVLVVTFSCRPPQQETDYSQLEANAFVANFDPEKFTDEEVQVIVDQAKLRCDRAQNAGRILTRTERIIFPATRDCDFNDDADRDEWWKINQFDNGPRRNGKVRAYLRQNELLDLPEGSVLCDLDFDFPTQRMEYDDEIFLLLNGYVLAMSTNYSTSSSYSQYANEGLKTNSQGLVEFLWLDKENSKNDLYNLDYDRNQAPRYCQGIDSNRNDYDEVCQIPRTETTGEIKLDIPSQDIIKIGALKFDNLNSNEDLAFSFVTTGDNEDGDCEHAEYYFNVTIQYSEN